MDHSNQASRPYDAKPRASRHNAKGRLLVQAKTIGTNMSYVLRSENASASGFLLSWVKDQKLPFALNTILEIAIFPNSNSKIRIPCLGKIVRKESRFDQKVTYGIKIVQMDSHNQEQWAQYIDNLSQKDKVLPAA